MLKKSHIKLALKIAKESANKNEIPVGCVIFDKKGKDYKFSVKLFY